MSETERPPLRGWPRVVSLAALTLAVVAGTIFIVIIVLGSGGDTRLGDVFGPIGIAATSTGIVAAIASLFDARTRVLGVLCLILLLPSVFLSVLTLVALGS
jgi:hypothetical protein